MKSEPIRSKKKIEMMYNGLMKNSYRDYLLFRLGLNTALRISDLLKLRVKHFIHQDGTFKDYLMLNEKKTGKEKKIKLPKLVLDEVAKYVLNYELDSEDYIFFSFRSPERPLDNSNAWRRLKSVANDCGVENFGTHSMRKTRCRLIYDETKNIALVMDMLNHKSPAYTMRYIGISQDEQDKVSEEFIY